MAVCYLQRINLVSPPEQLLVKLLYYRHIFHLLRKLSLQFVPQMAFLFLLKGDLLANRMGAGQCLYLAADGRSDKSVFLERSSHDNDVG